MLTILCVSDCWVSTKFFFALTSRIQLITRGSNLTINEFKIHFTQIENRRQNVTSLDHQLHNFYRSSNFLLLFSSEFAQGCSGFGQGCSEFAQGCCAHIIIIFVFFYSFWSKYASLAKHNYRYMLLGKIRRKRNCFILIHFSSSMDGFYGIHFSALCCKVCDAYLLLSRKVLAAIILCYNRIKHLQFRFVCVRLQIRSWNYVVT